MKRATIAAVLLASVVLGPSSQTAAAGTQHTGIIGPPGNSACLQGTHTLTDPCTGAKTLLQSTRLNLDLFLGMHVRVYGQDVGVECRVVDVRQIRPVVEHCH